MFSDFRVAAGSEPVVREMAALLLLPNDNFFCPRQLPDNHSWGADKVKYDVVCKYRMPKQANFGLKQAFGLRGVYLVTVQFDKLNDQSRLTDRI